MDELELTNEEREKHIRTANILIGAINDLEIPMLMTQSEKDVTKEALENYIKMLEQQSFINKPCISEGVCHEDKMQVLDKIRADVINLKHDVDIVMYCIAIDDVLRIIDKYTEEGGDNE